MAKRIGIMLHLLIESLVVAMGIIFYQDTNFGGRNWKLKSAEKFSNLTKY
jgi:hypothetical protein